MKFTAIASAHSPSSTPRVNLFARELDFGHACDRADQHVHHVTFDSLFILSTMDTLPPLTSTYHRWAPPTMSNR